MTLTQAIRTVFFKKYATFKGRAQRSEYWWWALAIFLIGTAAQVIDIAFLASEVRTTTGPGSFSVEHNGPLASVLTLATIVPNLAVMVRRLHDSDKSGWWFLIAFVPLVGTLYFLYLLIRRGTDGPNRYGPDPLDPNPAAAHEEWLKGAAEASYGTPAPVPMSPEEEALRRRAPSYRSADSPVDQPAEDPSQSANYELGSDAGSDAEQETSRETRRRAEQAPLKAKETPRPSWRAPTTRKDGFQTTQERFKDK